MRILITTIALLCLASCSSGEQFAKYEREVFDTTRVGASTTKVVAFQNPDLGGVQHIANLDFDSGTNSKGHFRIDKVEVGGVSVNPRDKDITIPAGSIMQIYITYQPLDLVTSIANYGGWSTGAVKVMKALVAKGSDPSAAAIHRAILVAVYDHPKPGVVQIELVGEALPGPNGEVSAVGGGNVECPTTAGTLCYSGGFAIELPDIMTGGAKPLEITGPIVFSLTGATVSLDMATFPAVMLVMKGNGPGEPLEGKPIDAVSIVISGVEDVTATGTFDGSDLDVTGVAFRIRVILGEIEKEDITPGLQAAVDFEIPDLTIATTKPYSNGTITLVVDTTLSPEPSGNPMFDQFLGSAHIIVTMDGKLEIL